MAELDHKEDRAVHQAAWPSCRSEADHRFLSSHQVLLNPLSAIVPDAGVNNEAYQDDHYDGATRGWLDSLSLVPQQGFADVALTVLNTVIAVASIARGRRPSAARRRIKPGENTEMLGQAIRHVKTMPGTAAEKADAFERMAKQISNLSVGGWAAERRLAADGSHVFTGPNGAALVISPQGQLYRGFLHHGGVRETAAGQLEPDFALLRLLE